MLKLGSHALALTGALAVHGAIGAWLLQPAPPIALPQQQVIRVAMLTAATPETPKPLQAQAPVVPPKKHGMKKAEEKKAEPKQAEPENQPQQLASLSPASGPQSAVSLAQHAALSEPIFEADYLQNTPPVYPPAARRRNEQGEVLLKVEVSEKGAATQVAVTRSSGSTLLDEAARKAVERWRFIPARRGSETIAAQVAVPIIFKLGE